METRERKKVISSNVDKVYMGGGAVGAKYGDMYLYCTRIFSKVYQTVLHNFLK